MRSFDRNGGTLGEVTTNPRKRPRTALAAVRCVLKSTIFHVLLLVLCLPGSAFTLLSPRHTGKGKSSREGVNGHRPLPLRTQRIPYWTAYSFLRTTPSSRLAASVAPPSSDRSGASSSYADAPRHQQHRRHHPKRRRRTKREQVRYQFRKAQDLERRGLWRKAAAILHQILALDPTDAHSHLALARLQARRAPDTDKALEAFVNGTKYCPDSIHLWQAFAVHEETHGRIEHARKLFERALQIDPNNPYVCHAYGLMEEKLGHADRSKLLWERALQKTSSAALVCSLGQWYIARNEYGRARNLYAKHVLNLPSERQQTEVYLAAAWLEERYFRNFDRAADLIQLSLALSPTSSVAQVALARLEGRRRQNQQNSRQEAQKATMRRLASACIEMEQKKNTTEYQPAQDGRVFNAWANMEVKANRLKAAKNILQRGLRQHPNDFSLMQAAGNVEERLGNYTGARRLYSSSLRLQPSAPSLVAFALLELKHPESGKFNFTQIKRLFEEALLLDPRHAPAYNAYARSVFEKEQDEDASRAIFERGAKANCPDAASLYHGYAKLELALGNVNRARELLLEGRREANRQDIGKDSPHRERALFLTHTLGMLELNSNRPSEALDIFTEGVERYGNWSQLLLGAALCEVKLGNVEKARHLFERSVLNDEKHAHAWQAWAVMEMRAGNYETAKTLFECGIKCAPRHGPLWQAYAVMESRMGHEKQARLLFENGIKHAPHQVSLYQGWASLELRLSHFEHAKVLITQALTRNKRNGAGWLIAAEIEDRLGNTGLGKLLLRRGIECSPTDPALYNALGNILVQENKINEAREIYEKGIEVDPLYASLYHSLAELEARVCNLEGLSKLNKRAAEVFNTNVLEPPALASEVWGSKIRAGRRRSVPREVAALAERISDEEGEDRLTEDGDPDSFLDNMSTSLLEHGLVSQLLSMDS